MVDERVTLPDTDAAPDSPEKDKPSTLRGAAEWVLILVGALVVAIVVKTFLLQAFYIPSASMEPTLKIGDRVLVNKLSYDFHDVHRGDIVVFKSPPGEDNPDVKDLIKRVIGLPGDTVEGHDGRVYINGNPLKEPYLPAGTTTSPFSVPCKPVETPCSSCRGSVTAAPGLPPCRVPKGAIWVMGDNRSNSKDSRFFGPIKENLVVGRAFIKVWPLSQIGLL